jgi:dihydroflavonol-4-reductase
MRPDAGLWWGRAVCVTGGTGFLGYHLVRRLLSLGARVRVLALPPSPGHALMALSGVELVAGDVRDAQVVRQALAGQEVVFHTAGIVAVWGSALPLLWSVHVEGTRNVLAHADPAARIVHTSSIVAVGASASGRTALDEASPFNLASLPLPYIHAKRAAEQLALEAADRDIVVVNPAYLVGPEDHEGSIMGRFCQRFWKGRSPLPPPGGINLVDVRDAAEGHLLAAERGARQRRYILGGEDHTFVSFQDALSRAAGYRPRLRPRLPGWALTALAGLAECRGWLTGKEPYPSLAHARLNCYFWFVRSDRARRELGYVPRPLDATLADAYAWYVSACLLV